jgi:hypothetical protein
MHAQRCKRIRTETWRAPGGPGSSPWPHQTREMRAQCVLNEGHLDDKQDHIWGDWLETSVVR